VRTRTAGHRRATPRRGTLRAERGSKVTGGRWTRPDLVSVALRTYRYLPGKYLEVVTFEVKAADAITVTARSTRRWRTSGARPMPT
jgi:hypothetical protein